MTPTKLQELKEKFFTDCTDIKSVYPGIEQRAFFLTPDSVWQWIENILKEKEEEEGNPFACYGNQKPHRMDFDDEEEYLHRLNRYEEWELKNKTNHE